MLTTMVNDLIGNELAAVEALFEEELRSDLPCVNALVRHVSRFRGKMLRPTLVLLSGRAAGRLTEAHVVLATVVEMVHMATLVHDDVLDEAELRRKGATINHLRGNEAAVMLGDHLISHAFHLCSSLDSQLASRAIGRTTNQVCEGELLQIHHRQDVELDEATYLEIITRKTASLCATCCMLGAKFAGAGDVRVSQLELFGLSVGRAFQIQDDILDLVGDESVVGKTLGIDVEKGKLTLPVIHFLRTAPREHRELLRSLLREAGRAGDGVDGADGGAAAADKAERIRNLILPSPSIEYARARARQHVARAKGALADLPDSDARRLLDSMADFVVARGA